MEWQPIESAPRDGRAFIVWLDDEGFSTMCRWSEREGMWWFDGFDAGQSDADAVHLMTGWMPFPAQGIETGTAEIAQQAPSEG